nr:MAG TPA: hypothetical protein [Caudoviricetes sp.]
MKIGLLKYGRDIEPDQICILVYSRLLINI